MSLDYLLKMTSDNDYTIAYLKEINYIEENAIDEIDDNE